MKNTDLSPLWFSDVNDIEAVWVANARKVPNLSHGEGNCFGWVKSGGNLKQEYIIGILVFQRLRFGMIILNTLAIQVLHNQRGLMYHSKC